MKRTIIQSNNYFVKLFLYLTLFYAPLFAGVVLEPVGKSAWCTAASKVGQRSCFVDVGEFLLVTNSGQNEQFAKDAYEAAFKKTGKKVGLLVHTSSQKSCIGGSSYYLKKGVAVWNGFGEAKAQQVEIINSSRTLRADAGDVEVFKLGNESLVLFLPKEALLFAGDLTIAIKALRSFGGDANKALTAIKKLEDLNASIIVGSFNDISDFAQTKARLHKLRCALEQEACDTTGKIYPKRANARCGLHFSSPSELSDFSAVCKTIGAKMK